MPVHLFFSTAVGARVAVFRITESGEELRERLGPGGFVETPVSGQRQLQRLAVWCLLKEIFPGDEVKLSHRDDGHPVLSNGWQVSVSHSGEYAAVMVHPEEAVGIDIQVPKPHISSGKSLFLRNEEQEAFGRDLSVGELHLTWCAKEALYKMAGDTSLNVYSHFTVEPFEAEISGRMIGMISTSTEKMELEFRVEDGFFLVYSAF